MKRALALTFVAAIGLTLSTPALSGKKKKNQDTAPAPAAQTEANDEPEAPPEPADGPHAAVVAYRHTLLEGVAKHFVMSKMILMGKVDRPNDLAGHARAIQASFVDFGTLFPEGSGPDAYPQTDALGTIWTDAAGFEAAIARVQAEAATFVERAEAGDMDGAKAQFGKVGASCGGCHETFRADDD
ncbi:MAG: cytochrome c [Myxococcota bacterium]